MSISRRNFLKGSAIASVSSALPLSLTLPSNAFAAGGDDYKAIVCLFLYGGNDSFNMIVPSSGNNYDNYVLARPDIHLTSAEILTIPNTESGQKVSINSGMPKLAQLMTEGNATAVVNVGTLLEPTNKDNYDTVKRPASLGAHNKQQIAWQVAWNTAEYHPYGWAGMMMDILANDAATVSESLSMSGNALLGGQTSQDLRISSDGVRAMDALGHSNAVNNNFNTLVNSPYGSDFSLEYINRLKGIIDFQAELDSVMNNFPADESIPASYLGNQCRMVKRIMEASTQLNHQRQVFFISIGGFDNHNNQRGKHDGVLTQIDEAISAFHSSLESVGLQDKVVTFTMSDFGRTVRNNSNKGTDHGWGSNQLIVGNAVNGGQIYGQYPEFMYDGVNAAGNKFMPSTSSEQMAATLCRWFGLSDTGVDYIFPSLNPANDNAFASRYLGFLGDASIPPSVPSLLSIAAVSASTTRSGHTPQMAIDGDSISKWTAKGQDITFTIELTHIADLSEIKWSQARGDERQYYVDVEISTDGTSYTPVSSITTPGNSTALVSFPITKKNVKYIRLTCNGNSDSNWNNFQEIEVWGN
ncbi:DUF1501 domain-containing protein [Photobacterium profundum]|uniref:F5/8 type C domain-containing protein n=1 Tax=Photobacterium profundum 3TCK TaxID=314280 RepID=Q1Z8Y8_9GAMM|nr:DUF1501 domain-containing protein [Photobacterium profundum]EAS44970.1 hypothetical protein P3TCK_20840 [Photobacterium profundum 3TCK]PSV60053.1 DUF1501 domain-containing protein [Photobacterium profundum]